MFAGAILNGVLSLLSPALGILGALVTLAELVWSLVLAIVMANELKSVTRSETFVWWPLFVPIYNWYWALISVPREVASAKQRSGVQRPPRSIVLYFCFYGTTRSRPTSRLARCLMLRGRERCSDGPIASRQNDLLEVRI